MTFLLYWYTESNKERHCIRSTTKDYLVDYAREHLEDDPDVADYEIYVPLTALEYSEHRLDALKNRIALAVYELQKGE